MKNHAQFSNIQMKNTEKQDTNVPGDQMMKFFYWNKYSQELSHSLFQDPFHVAFVVW